MAALVSIGWAAVERARGAYADALRLAEAGTRLAEDHSHPWFAAYGNAVLAWIWTELGDAERAMGHGERAVAAAERDGVANWVVRAQAHLAWAAWAAGDRARAVDHADRAEALLAAVRTPPGLAFLHGGHAYVATARVRLGQGEHDRVKALLEPLLSVAGSVPWLEVVIDASIVLGRSHLVGGWAEEAERLLVHAARLAEAHGFARATWEANAALSGLLRTAGHVERAEERMSAALAAVRRAASSLEDATLAARFPGHPLGVLELAPV